MQIAKELTALFIKAKTFPNQVPDTQMTATIGLFKNLCPFSFLSLSSDQNILIIN